MLEAPLGTVPAAIPTSVTGRRYEKFAAIIQNQNGAGGESDTMRGSLARGPIGGVFPIGRRKQRDGRFGERHQRERRLRKPQCLFLSIRWRNGAAKRRRARRSM